ncbi:type IV pilus twitching motility protein PilT [Anaerotalea alkaliphila]|uniref:Type IV pilus twitching motility protein PilT n=1 Tax=Anaerotalea alkaliphila TaxID=2662126 RepID=A0A7X5HX30_9FIRM|nr:type IV pilus twitching motility protein PilT [Anaerotalea alkaliphila]NDL68230.1 type IV pilus twitching motility protein PilT [Anaerotalea alkaliphila]
MNLHEMMALAKEKRASDLHIKVGSPPLIRVDGELLPIREEILLPDETELLTRQCTGPERFQYLAHEGDLDFSYSAPHVARFRVNAFRQRNTYGMAMRLVNTEIPTLKSLNLPAVMESFTDMTHGLVLVTGPTGSGKSTSLASMIQMINEKRNAHIITLEDPIEYLYKNAKASIAQREIGLDTKSFAKGLRSALRQDPDIILVGEMRDLETIEIALLAAETGHLVFSTLHTLGAAKTIDRVIDAFPTNGKEQVKVQLASVLQAVVSQQLLPNKTGFGRVPVCEVMVANTGIRNMIREGKTHQIQNSIVTGKNQGMITMDESLKNLYQNGTITKQEAITHALDREELSKTIDF